MKEENLNKAINLYEKIKELRQVMNADGRVTFALRTDMEEKKENLYLCIGDLVYDASFAIPKVCEVTGVFKDTQNAEYDYAYIVLYDAPRNTHKADYWELEGIPITDEILMLNGFEGRNYAHDNDFYRHNDRICIRREQNARGETTYNCYIDVDYDKYDDPYYINEDDHYIANINYVHELQQVLRAFGEDSELKAK